MFLDNGYPKLDLSGGIAQDMICPRRKSYLLLTRNLFFKNWKTLDKDSLFFLPLVPTNSKIPLESSICEFITIESYLES